MELKKIIAILLITFFSSSLHAELIKPNKELDPYDVIKIQLNALQDNDDKDNGIKQTWYFAHPDNKKYTGPYDRFRIMLYGQQYKYLINHFSHKIKLISNSPNTYIYRIEILSLEKNYFSMSGTYKKEVMMIVKIVGSHLLFLNQWIRVIRFEKTTFHISIYYCWMYSCYTPDTKCALWINIFR